MNSKNAVLTALLLFFITLEVLVAFDYVYKQKDMREVRTSLYVGITELQHLIGYVGLIHNFKNAILRPDEIHYRQQAFENYQKAIIQLAKIEDQGKLINGDFAMPATKAMLTAYRERLALIPGLLEQNMNLRELDNYLRYDDEPSRSELQLLTEKITAKLERMASDLLGQSLKSGLFVLIALLITLVTIMRFYFKEQQEALTQSNTLNVEMEKHKTDMARSQAILLSMMQDVEKEKHQAMTLNEKLSDKNKEMERFVYTVSHDLKSPLVTIAAFTKKLKAELTDTLTEKQAHRFSRIIENVSNLEGLLTDLLDLSRIVQQAITTTQVDVKSVVTQQSILLENNIIEAGATIKIADELHSVNANERLLSEAILNLLSNAIRYRDPERALIIDIFTTQSTSSTTIHVKDNGIGISSKYHKLIFGLFEKLSTTIGTGIGLTIVKTIMDKHDGKVILASQFGEGSSFSLEFPNEIKAEVKR